MDGIADLEMHIPTPPSTRHAGWRMGVRPMVARVPCPERTVLREGMGQDVVDRRGPNVWIIAHRGRVGLCPLVGRWGVYVGGCE